MSIHKLTAGSGYDYLTRQVAALDSTEKGPAGLASYYTERGETPGVWVGSGLAGIDGLSVGDVVTAEQMQALFGFGLHPLAAERQRLLYGPGLTEYDYQTVARLGAPFKVFAPDVSAFRVEVAKRIAGLNEASGLPGDWPVPATDRAKVRTEVARELFAAENGRNPADARELASTIARHSRPRTQAIAGYDLTFSPVKSVSVLWAVADPATAAAIERAHRAAVNEALTFLETHALFTRTGTNGVRQVNVRGLVATAFTHRDSRAGDPDLHTHVAVANKVQTEDGRWLSIDGRVLFKATVAASETYNTALEHHLSDRLGVRFVERPNPDQRLRLVREIVGVHPDLNARWSARRADIDTRRGQLATTFQSDHGRPPTPIESLHLAQQATLETRAAKHEPRSLAEQRATWQAEASEVLGGPRKVRAMTLAVLSPTTTPDPAVPDALWVSETAALVVAAMEERRSTWQVWHVRAEAQRRVRTVNVPTGQVEGLVDLLVAEALERRSVSLARVTDGVVEPAVLRRSDGQSVYTVAGSTLFTSAGVLAAEERLLRTAGRSDGFAVDSPVVDVALLTATANGVTLNAGQASLVQQMATSGCRLQLAIAPAGSGKTTAMQALAAAWTDGGGNVVGLAPSAAAAAQLRDQINNGDRSGVATDTLAKLVWSLQHDDLPGWADNIGVSTLVVIDEAGMADTLSLDTVVQFVVGRGGSVRLVGDDQQLSAIGAGGVLRDIQATHGAVRLAELLRFTDPAEGAASLALRDGHTEALGFYLDHHRVHVGDLTTLTDQVFAAWQADRSNGLDAIMLAPTRDLVADLNQRARADRLTHTTPTGSVGSAAVTLADGDRASVGDLVITRANDRRLRTSATDWVKNGDRWTVVDVTNGTMKVQHTQTGRQVRLTAEYVRTSTNLGYATTVHTAQGVTADTMHGLVGGEESRQQLYTMMTRGRGSNHMYLSVVGDGDPHTVIKPEMVSPSTPTDLLERILAFDDAPSSALTFRREQDDPTVRLGETTARYVDALHVAAEQVARPDLVSTLEVGADRLVPGVTDSLAWPTLRAHLLLIAADGADPLRVLKAAADGRELRGTDDPAAVLDWRLDATGHRNTRPGPLPWLPGIPGQLRTHPDWGDYLTARAQLVRHLADQVRQQAREEMPTWAAHRGTQLPLGIAGDVAVWRAALQVDVGDRRLTGPVQLSKAARSWQARLDRAAGDQSPAYQEWKLLIGQTAAQVHLDDFAPVLADRLAAISRAGIDSHRLLLTAAAAGPLPDEHVAAALWWRIHRHLAPPVASNVTHTPNVTTLWAEQLAPPLGDERSQAIQASPWWPSLVTVVDHAQQRGWQINDLINTAQAASVDTTPDDVCQRMVWRISLLTDSVPTDDQGEPFADAPPEDMYVGVDPATPDEHHGSQRRDVHQADRVDTASSAEDGRWVEAGLAVAAMVRDTTGPPEQTDADIRRMTARDDTWRDSSVSRDRMVAINQMTWQYYRNQFPHSWGPHYIRGRFGQDLTGPFQPGQAPAGWTHLVNHLRHHGVTDAEMTIAGVAVVASTGRVIDRFRNRVVFPIVHNGDILGFVGRRHPDLTDDDHSGPKYLNTPETPLFHKGAQLFCATETHLATGATPVIVEGPIDAIAVTIATNGSYVGVSPLGTSLTGEQAAQLGRTGIDPVVATDGDLAGQVAAERDFWLLTPYRLDPRHAPLPDGTDPADLLTLHGSQALDRTLTNAGPLAQTMIEERVTNLPPAQAVVEAVRVVAARPSNTWRDGSDLIASRLQLSTELVRKDLYSLVQGWNADPRVAAHTPLHNVNQVKERLAAAALAGPDQRWTQLATQLDPRLTHQSDWPALVILLQRAHNDGHDVAAVMKRLVAETSLNDRPAQDLRYRLANQLNITLEARPTPSSGRTLARENPSQLRTPRPASPLPHPNY